MTMGSAQLAGERNELLLKLAEDVLAALPEDVKQAVQTAAIARYFSAQTLGILLAISAAEATCLFRQLSGLPFVQPYDEGTLTPYSDIRFALLQEWKTPDRRLAYCALNERLADHYSRICKADSLRSRRETIEAIYHQLAVDEDSGFVWLERELLKALALGQLDFFAYLLRAAEERTDDLRPDHRLWLLYHKGLLLEKLQKRQQAEEAYRYLEIQDGWPSEIRAS